METLLTTVIMYLMLSFACGLLFAVFDTMFKKPNLCGISEYAMIGLIWPLVILIECVLLTHSICCRVKKWSTAIKKNQFEQAVNLEKARGEAGLINMDVKNTKQHYYVTPNSTMTPLSFLCPRCRHHNDTYLKDKEVGQCTNERCGVLFYVKSDTIYSFKLREKYPYPFSFCGKWYVEQESKKAEQESEEEKDSECLPYPLNTIKECLKEQAVFEEQQWCHDYSKLKKWMSGIVKVELEFWIKTYMRNPEEFISRWGHGLNLKEKVKSKNEGGGLYTTQTKDLYIDCTGGVEWRN